MRFGICAPYHEVAPLQIEGLDYLEENVQRFLVPERSQEEFETLWREAQRLPMPIEAANSFIPASLPLIATVTQTVDTARLERYVQTALRRAEQVGIRVIVFGSGAARACPEGYNRRQAHQQLAEHLAHWGDLAGQHGVQIVLEPLRTQETNTLNTVAESGELVASIKQPAIKLLADTYHMALNGEAPEDIALWPGLLTHVHVAEERERAAPGRFHEDFHPYFSALQQAGYDQRISIECHWLNLASEAGAGIAILKQQWREAQEQRRT